VHAAGPQDNGQEVSHHDARCTILLGNSRLLNEAEAAVVGSGESFACRRLLSGSILKLVVDKTNKDYEEHVVKKRLVAEKAKAAEKEKHMDNVRKIADDLTFG
jgi:hypothetical protein